MRGYSSGALLDRASLLILLEAQPPLVEGLYSREEQVQPNGIDLSLREVLSFGGVGGVGVASEERSLALLEPIPFDEQGWLTLSPGPYTVIFNEVVHLPLDIVALGRPRTSLLRNGVAIHTGVWDAGYSGRSQSLMVVYNGRGFRLKRQARILQLIFLRLQRPVGQGYEGRFQGEGL